MSSMLVEAFSPHLSNNGRVPFQSSMKRVPFYHCLQGRRSTGFGDNLQFQFQSRGDGDGDGKTICIFGCGGLGLLQAKKRKLKKNNNSHSRIYAAKRCTNFSFSRFYHGNGNDDDLRLICLWESEELDNADGGEPTSMPVPAVPVPCKA